ncbi:hypothetical protein PR202_ga03924 [Eleusine coracana subsp. coracana]|uniref:Exocyst subunit Exo70 family protein n=1 Tax=Eleusine coracana subsp. coracana TaxID=191504 RepID=A0AAV5BQN5_ELECO|nr:hypothetical protein QOZ80_5AG0382640 [Eleusine coracana subsp. coracana]GJM87918.1 hypothetical protein PR202_ga03924 [Eleusine coracana subsp. coracana]
MDSRSQPPNKSSSFSPATTRDDGGRTREVDRNLSLGSGRHRKDHHHHHHHHGPAAASAAAHREQSIREEEDDEDEEEANDGSDLAALSAEIDAFIAGGGQGDVAEPATLERFAAAVERAIARSEGADDKWATTDGDGDGEEHQPPPLLATITRVAALSSALGKHGPGDERVAAAAHRVGAVTQRAMAFLEDEFHGLLEGPKPPPPDEHDRCFLPSAASSAPPPPPPEESSATAAHPPYPPETVRRLRLMADAMVSAGYTTECTQVFLVARRNAFDAALKGLGYDKSSSGSAEEVARMAWEALEPAIASWTRAFRHAANVGLSTEHDLCARVFVGRHAAAGRAVFADLARCVTLHLLSFTDAVARTTRATTEKLFKVLDMYEAVRDAAPIVDAFVLADDCPALNELKAEVAAVRARLCDSAAAIFRELESSIRADAGKQPVPGGAVHPLTRYVMNYVKFACAYNATLEQVFREHNHHTEPEPDKHQNPFAAQLVEVMELLHENLEAKSRLYKDPSLSSIFLMNNGRYMLQKIRGSPEINAMLGGESWARNQSTSLRQYHKNYQRETWSRVLGMLRDDGVITVKGHVQKPVLKERFKQFNAAMDEIHRTQGAWVVSDEQLQSELRVSIAAVVVPAYRSFLGRFAQHFSAGRQTEKYVKLSAEDVETIIDELFDGNATSMARRRT